MLTKPALLVRSEAFAYFVLAILAYRALRGNWGDFALLFLAPDLFMLGYLVSARLGATLYNFAHVAATPCLLAAIAFAASNHSLLLLSLVWVAHIEIDRVFGYGLKYPTFFKDTHLQHL
ncbi:DUF4260 family protein [Acidobacteria bacterium AB60]|nr:DUF4260 family protein [Acidobacteria bacterium AB60]